MVEAIPAIRLDAVLPEMVMAMVATETVIMGLLLPRRKQWMAGAGAAVGIAAALALALIDMASPEGLVFSGAFADDAVTGLARVIILSGTLLVFALSVEHVRGDKREAEYWAMLAASSAGAMLLAGASDLMLVIVAYLISSVPLYMLTAFRRDERSTEAAMKVYLMAALFSVLMLFGLSWLYGAGGATAYVALSGALSPEVGAAVAVGVIGGLGGLMFKVGAVPAHFWVADAAEGAPEPVAAYITTIPKIGGLVAAGRLVSEVVPPDLVEWPTIVAVVSAVSMTLGNLAAFWQDDPRRLLGYSTIAQAGFLLMGVVALGASDVALPGLMYYIAAYVAMNLGAFAVVAEVPQWRRLADYRGFARAQPALALSLVIALLSLVGIPPLAGFFGKLLVFTAAWDAGFAWLTVIAAVNTVISLFYYLRWVAPMYFGTGVAHGVPKLAGAWAKWGAYAAALATIALGIGARFVVDVVDGVEMLGG